MVFINNKTQYRLFRFKKLLYSIYRYLYYWINWHSKKNAIPALQFKSVSTDLQSTILHYQLLSQVPAKRDETGLVSTECKFAKMG